LDIAVSLVASVVPAIISGFVTFFVARHNFGAEIEKIKIQFSHQKAGQIATLRQRYMNPLRYWASRMSNRLLEIEDKSRKSEYHMVQKWFKIIKDHADGNKRMNGFPVWCYYEGIFAMTTLYYTCSYIQCAREIRFRLPFSEFDPDYSEKLDEHLSRVSEALGGIGGIWDSSQEVVGERFTRGEAKMDNEELCRIIDSHDEFKIAPFIRLIDVYIESLDGNKAESIRAALDELIRFVNSEPTPEKGA